MKDTPIDYQTVQQIITNSGIAKIGKASIRELVKIVNTIEAATSSKFIRMEMGVPGLPAPQIGINAEIEALQSGFASIYADIEGVKELKYEFARFVKLFLNIDVTSENCIPTVGSMQGSCACFLVANRTDASREGTLFLDPGFPVQKQQAKLLGQKFQAFDVYNYRGQKLHEKLEEILKTGKISSILYSNPNNPSWINFTEEELKIIGNLATKYDVIVVEDLAYFAMDFRKDYSKPGQAPFQPTVAKYTENYVLLVSSSKSFSYAGQRIGMMVISPALYHRKYPDLLRYFSSDGFGHSIIYGVLYALSAGVSHTTQYALAAMLKAANNGEFDFVHEIRQYGIRAKEMKRLFTENGFEIVYDSDIDEKIGDGFYFTFSYPGFSGADLVEELLYYGISAISLDITGSERSEGLRACVSQTSQEQFAELEKRLKCFKTDHPI